jgi:hypothetical protein
MIGEIGCRHSTTACTVIANAANNKVSCTTSTDSKAAAGFLCKAGYFLARGAASAADRCSGMPNKIRCMGASNRILGPVNSLPEAYEALLPRQHAAHAGKASSPLAVAQLRIPRAGHARSRALLGHTRPGSARGRQTPSARVWRGPPAKCRTMPVLGLRWLGG